MGNRGRKNPSLNSPCKTHLYNNCIQTHTRPKRVTYVINQSTIWQLTGAKYLSHLNGCFWPQILNLYLLMFNEKQVTHILTMTLNKSQPVGSIHMIPNSNCQRQYSSSVHLNQKLKWVHSLLRKFKNHFLLFLITSSPRSVISDHLVEKQTHIHLETWHFNY